MGGRPPPKVQPRRFRRHRQRLRADLTGALFHGAGTGRPSQSPAPCAGQRASEGTSVWEVGRRPRCSRGASGGTVSGCAPI
ncbi:hypothetical protein [Streptomyces dysideae]|uniref:hypothetical protein n=1 Tax=Streptomyces dysideae TaxID=909626 RepID=UPI000AA2D76A|nr:hypothetical protein [Streptomyces dysideae]